MFLSILVLLSLIPQGARMSQSSYDEEQTRQPHSSGRCVPTQPTFVNKNI